MKFTFDDEMIEIALRANGYTTAWHDENWIHESSSNPDWSGMSREMAFEKLLHSKNLVPRNFPDLNKGKWWKQ